MTNEMMTQHITAAEFADYFEAQLSEERESDIEVHFAECDACNERARHWQAFSQIWDHWTAQAHGAAYWQVRLREGQLQADASDQTIKDRLAAWRIHWAGCAAAAARVILEAPGKTAEILTEGLEALILPQGGLHLALAPAVGMRGRRAGPIRTRGKTSPQAEVVAGERVAIVRLTGWPSGQRPPLVLLIPAEGGTPKVLQLAQQPGGTDLIASLEGVDLGDYLMAVEPMGPAQA